MMMTRWWMVMVVAGMVACSAGTYSGESGGPPASGLGDAGPIATPTDLPCDVANFLAADCLLCHGPVPKNGAPDRLDSLAALKAPSYSQPSKSNGALALERIQSATSPMPPAPYARASSTQISAFASWIDGGMPAGSCTPPGDAGTPPIADGGVDAGPSDGGVSGDLPCDVADVLTSACTSCHGNPPIGGAPMSLTSLDLLRAASPSNAAVTNGQASVQRMASTTSRMPPAPAAPVPAGKQSAFSAWVSSGMPAGSCGVDGGTPDPAFTGPPTCSSGQYWSGGESSTMRPGEACIACHARGEGPTFAIAGTAYPTGHEYDDCYGSAAQGATVTVTDRNNVSRSFTVNSAGNFSGSGSGGWPALPITARITANGQTRVMSGAVNTGDCNTCHTLNGASGAPGRIALP